MRDERPLTVAVTRPLPAGHELARLLREEGVEVVLCPALEIAPPRNPASLRNAVARCVDGAFGWTVFTSANGVRAFLDVLLEVAGTDAQPPIKVAAVGKATASVAEAHGWEVHRVPAVATAEGLLAEFEQDLRGVSILIPAAEEGRDVLPVGLKSRGARVEVVTAYRSLPHPDAAKCREAVQAGRVHALTFTSPSSARNFLEAIGESALSIPAIVIGPVTEGAARALGFRVEAVAEVQSTEGLVEAVVTWARERD